MTFNRILPALALLLLAALLAAAALTGPLAWAVGLLYIGYDTWLLGHMVLSSRRAVADSRAAAAAEGAAVPSLTVLIAARNEQTALPQALDALIAQSQPAERIIVIDDGSTDRTLAMLEERYGVRVGDGAPLGEAREPALAVLRKTHSGKARSLNAALPLCDTELVVTLDADTVLEPGALAAVRRAFAARPELGAACGVLRPVCQGGRAFELYQTFEYLRSFLWRMAWGRERTLILISGAFAIFRRAALEDVGGFDPASRVEDYELLFRLHRRSRERGRALETNVIGDARATTDAPARPLVFLRQRARWFAGFIETMFKNRDMVGNRRFGRLGKFHLIVKTIDMLLPIYALSAFASLLWFLVRGARIPGVIVAAVVVKLAFDLGCHVFCLFQHERWQGRRVTPARFARAALATLTEPYAFQLLRQLAAVLGWIAFLRGRIEWAPQRAVTVSTEMRGEME